MPVHPTTSTPAATGSTPHDDAVHAGAEPLRLTSVLAGGLPATLGTPDAPSTYTVSAVFSRQVSAGERTAIQARESAQRLADAGYPRVTLDVADRRLLIGNTHLEQLRDGLAHELAELLRDIDRTLAEQRDQREAEALVRQSAEADRAADIQDVVDEITFA